jgi:hypothetical protein
MIAKAVFRWIYVGAAVLAFAPGMPWWRFLLATAMLGWAIDESIDVRVMTAARRIRRKLGGS